MGWDGMAVRATTAAGQDVVRIHRPTAGFSLIEVMLAVAVVAVGLLGIAAIQLKALQGGTSARVYTQAAEFAYGRLEQLRTQGFATLAAGGGWIPRQPRTATVRNDQGTSITTQTYQVSDRITATGGTRTIDVRVQWTGRDSGHAPGPGMGPGQHEIIVTTGRFAVAPTVAPGSGPLGSP